MEPVKYFGGVEGGATHSNAIICSGSGAVIGTAVGAGTNHWALGIDTCADRVLAMVRAAKEDAGLGHDVVLDCLGLTLSGCEQDSTNEELAERVREKDTQCARAVFVASDTAGSLHTGAPLGGMVVIAGTGSNALLLTPQRQKYSCGGWGHLLGDEGGAWWISRLAVKTVLDTRDGLRAAVHDTSALWGVLQQYFQAATPADLLPHAYQHFDKSKFAGVCEHIAELASLGDAMSRHVLSCGGAALGAHVAALCEQAGVGGASGRAGGGAGGRAGGGALRVVCVGSVWRSWQLIKPGLLQELRVREVQTPLEFVRLRVSSGLGAAWLAARHVGYNLPRDDEACIQVFHTYRPGSDRDSEGDARGGDIGGGDQTQQEGCGCARWTWS